ncbi:hypothetical protein RHS01_02315 [Rhizoctonia solani]|uniref:Uncharacterized protein n=1 Tax=Rhizoctonia solani TaxID=456999 RepID=A0A8H7M903_9AGAM|nr:hypothetical protein RHS01_02315 [Rhizoctonia solani]
MNELARGPLARPRHRLIPTVPDAVLSPRPGSLSHSAYSLSRSQTTSFSHSSTFIATPASSSRSRSVAEARALVLDPAYSGVGQTQARVYVDELGIAHDPDYRMFPAVPSSPRSCTARRGSVTSARGGRCGERRGMFGEPVYRNHEVDSEEDRMCMDVDEDAESVLEWSRLHASASPPGYEEGKEEEKKSEADGYADFDGMEWDEKEWRREEVVPAPALDKHQSSSLASSKGKQSIPSPAPLPQFRQQPFLAPRVRYPILHKSGTAQSPSPAPRAAVFPPPREAMYLPRGRTMRASKTNGHHPVDTQFAAIGNRLRSESDLPYSAGAESYAEHSRQLALVPVWIKELRNYPVRSMHQIGGLRDHVI